MNHAVRCCLFSFTCVSIFLPANAFSPAYSQGLLRPDKTLCLDGCSSPWKSFLPLQGVKRKENTEFTCPRNPSKRSVRRRDSGKVGLSCSLQASAGWGLSFIDVARDAISAVVQRPWVVAITLFVAFFLPFAANLAFREKQNLPPVAPGVSALKALRMIPHPIDGIPFLKQILNETGYPIFRIQTLIPFNFFWIGDPEATRLVIAGNRSAQFEELDKAVEIYAGLNVVTNQQPSVDTKSTYATSGPYCGWQETRSSMAPSFSTQNLLRAREVMVAKVETLSRVIERHIAEDKALVRCNGIAVVEVGPEPDDDHDVEV
eukprot:3254337-Rhodomonas_salina.3